MDMEGGSVVCTHQQCTYQYTSWTTSTYGSVGWRLWATWHKYGAWWRSLYQVSKVIQKPVFKRQL
jgi:hypothetical protein